MRMLAMTMGAVLAIQPAGAETLSPADREALLEKLEKLRENADSKVDARFRMAIAAYNAAAGGDQAAAEFHLQCIEKVDFMDQLKKNSDFREWKRKEAEKLSAPGRGLALRLQLRWLILTLRAASEKADRDPLISGVQEIVAAIARDAEKLKDHRQILSQPVTSSVFAKAYDIGEVTLEKWPLAPGDIGQIYEQILLPPLHKPGQLEALRSAWIRRIQQEMAVQESWAGENDPANRRIGTAAELRPPEYDFFVAETVPELQWQMELDLFKHGDEQAAALRMLGHLEKHINHKSARSWAAEFGKLLNPAAKPAEPSTP
ncbi:MAG: hypothetical protein EHM17_03110 [Verrucomicrobiaceae bacterium]|nr:MAG: hypothetical protein EHM17_03110 [Verrucomicrobiaceae bacterium]